ncbi:peptide ABC transporter substrate-binding protein [Caldisalinibacter kiritimatiensis]|uniref:Oligopeptide ABC transporter, periplasmic oligopeptide-binding protein OppA n=1 Tax=Caldisalinibacter kiritimatiensis TaxID=1304284 RepID=R1CT23_9FIRM|nr:peptide ABC transporter substrate-binding protein [Caldisalinibacter kiritimatiensis]EOC99848.1 Oligopeptide ABC transporter, periplasmic oligopeptide-binding protein OppA [Caldisalinibacter kiritimatiensis]
MRLKKISTVILSLLLIMTLVSCTVEDIQNNNGTKKEKEQNEVVEYEPSYGGELVVPISYVKTFNPLMNKDKSLYYFYKLIYEGLFEFDQNLNIKNVLAENYSIEDEGQVINIKLRQDVSWHDGEKFTAEDVKFTLDTIKYGAQNSVYREMMSSIFKPGKPGDLEHILNVEIIDEYNLKIIFDRSYSNALESLVLPILPRHQFVEDGINIKEAYESALELDNFKPVGTGPYKFETYNKLKSVTLVVNENWWKGKPYISRIIGKVLADDRLALTALKAGEIDLAVSVGVDWEKYAQNNKVKVFEYPTQRYEFLGFNFSKEIFTGEKGKVLREVIAYGTDKDEIIDKVYLDHAIKTDLPIPPFSWLVDENLNKFDFNVNKARDILEEAGWSDIDEDGIYEDVNGKELTLNLLTNSYNRLRKATADMIADNLTEVGIKVIKDYDSSNKENLTQDMINTQWENVQTKIANGDFDIVLTGWNLSYIPDLSFAFHSSQIEYGTNFIKYNNELMDKKLIEAFKAPSRNEKKSVYKEIQSILLEDLPYISLFFQESAILVNDKIHGEIQPKSFNIYYNIEEWFIPEIYQEDNKKDNNEDKQ